MALTFSSFLQPSKCWDNWCMLYTPIGIFIYILLQRYLVQCWRVFKIVLFVCYCEVYSKSENHKWSVSSLNTFRIYWSCFSCKPHFLEHFRSQTLTIFTVIEDDEFLPCILGDYPQDDFIQVDRWTNRKSIVIIPVAPGEPTATPWGPSCWALNEEVWDMHGICQRLEGSSWCATNGAD